MKFIDLERQYRRIQQPLDDALARLFVRQDFILGKDVDRLEERLADYAGVKHCITCSSGTDALSLSLMLLGVGPGDAVFVPDFTFFATAEAAALLGAVPVLVDCREDTFQIDPARLEEAVERVAAEGKLRPRVVIPVDLFGLCADYDAIGPIAQKYGLIILEDAAQSFGALYHGKRACSLGHLAATSFFPAKPLGCYGDGGAVFTNDDGWAASLRSLRVHGKGKNKYENNRLGLNARLDTMQAAVLNCKLDIFEDELAKRAEIASWYGALLPGRLRLPRIPLGQTSVYAQYTVLLPRELNRDAAAGKLREAGIPTMVYYERPLHCQKALRELGCHEGSFPVSERLSRQALSLPMHPYLSKGETAYIAEQLDQLLKLSEGTK